MKDYRSIEEVAKELGKSYPFVKKQIEKGDLLAVKVGSVYRISNEELKKFKKNVSHVKVTGFTLEEVAKNLNVSYALISKLVKDGEINAVKDGRRYIVPKEEIEKYMKRNTTRISDEEYPEDNIEEEKLNYLEEEIKINTNKIVIGNLLDNIQKLKQLVDDGVLTLEEFDVLKKKLLNQIEN